MRAIDAWIGRDATHTLWFYVKHCVEERDSGVTLHEFLATEANGD